MVGFLYVAGWAALFAVWVVTCAEQAGGYRGLVSGQWWMLEGGDGTHRVRFMLEDDEIYRTVTRLRPQDADLCFGIEEEHNDMSGKTCSSYVAWRPWSYMVSTGHGLVSLSPLTIDGSLGCSRCPSHGFIIEGRWRDA